MQVLNVIDDRVTDCQLNLLMTGLESMPLTSTVLAIGGGLLESRLKDFKAENITLTHLAGHPVFSFPALHFATFAEADVIHAWSVGCALLSILKARQKPIIVSLHEDIERQQVHWLRVACTVKPDLVILCHTDTLRGKCLKYGIPKANVHLLRPGLKFTQIERKRQAHLQDVWRRTPPVWGEPLVESNDSGNWLGLMCDDPRQISQLAIGPLLLLLLRYQMLDERYMATQPHLKLVVPSGCKKIAEPLQAGLMKHFEQAARLGTPVPGCLTIVFEERMTRPWEVLPGLDAVFFINDGISSLSSRLKRLDDMKGTNQGHAQAASGLSVLWAMAAQVPVAGHMSYELCEWLQDRHSAFLVTPGVDWKLAQAISHALGTIDEEYDIDGREAWKRADQARSDAFQYLSVSRYADDLKRVYRQCLTGEKVEVPQAAAVHVGMHSL